jgi:hypothetical protein
MALTIWVFLGVAALVVGIYCVLLMFHHQERPMAEMSTETQAVIQALLRLRDAINFALVRLSLGELSDEQHYDLAGFLRDGEAMIRSHAAQVHIVIPSAEDQWPT